MRKYKIKLHYCWTTTKAIKLLFCYLYVSFFIRVVKAKTPQHVLPWLQSLLVYPGSHPPTHCPDCLLHGESDKQWSLHWWIHSVPKVPSSHSRNTCKCYNSTDLIGSENFKKKTHFIYNMLQIKGLVVGVQMNV